MAIDHTGDPARRAFLAKDDRLRRLSPTERDLIRLARDPGFPRWLDQIRATGGCEHPVYLSGHTTVRDALGEILRHYDTSAEPGTRLAVRCGNRRGSRCTPCAYLHAGDTYQIVNSGLSGGKGIRADVRNHPAVFVTLTAPGFGPVHGSGSAAGAICRPRRGVGHCSHGFALACWERHTPQSAEVGTPLCPACYDYPGHVLWHAHAGRLWSRTADGIRRRLASAANLPRGRLRRYVLVAFAKVAEYQMRGAVHLHVVIRLDGPDGPASPPPSWASSDMLAGAVEAAVRSAEVPAPYSPAVGPLRAAWGSQMDVHAIGGVDVTPDAVAAYVAKYVTKSLGDAGGLDHRVHDLDAIRLAPVRPHLRALMGVCWRLGGLPELGHLRLRLWAHTLGYRGHILTKSRRYSTTYGALRSARGEHLGGAPLPDDCTTDRAWRYVTSGHTPAEAEIAHGVVMDRAASREARREADRDAR